MNWSSACADEWSWTLASASFKSSSPDPLFLFCPVGRKTLGTTCNIYCQELKGKSRELQKSQNTSVWKKIRSMRFQLILLSAAQPLGKLIPKTSSLLHLVPRLPPHKTHRLSYQLHHHGLTSVQAIPGIIYQQMDLLRRKIPVLRMHIGHHFLCDLLCRQFWGRLVNWNDFCGDEHFLLFKRKKRRKETLISLEDNLSVAKGNASNLISYRTGQVLQWERSCNVYSIRTPIG